MHEGDVLSLSNLTGDAPPFVVRPARPEDHEWVRSTLKQFWAVPRVVTRGRVHEADRIPALIAWSGPTPVGLLTYELAAGECEIVTHNSLDGTGGVGTLLLAEVRRIAREARCRRLWLVTSNDNTPAMRFYQRRDFDMVAVHRNAILDARALKPEIPEVGMFGIPVRHEVELEFIL